MAGVGDGVRDALTQPVTGGANYTVPSVVALVRFALAEG
jgi:hypothetical protein